MERQTLVAASEARVGAVLDGKYRLELQIGTGGMGTVFKANHLALERFVAVKLLDPKTSDTRPVLVRRFLREAQAVAKLSSEHVARVLDVSHSPGGVPYIVMEFLEGEDLSALVKQGPLEPDEAVDVIIQACSAMQEAHQLGIIHRDLKPANLFRSERRDGSPLIKVLDFGISKLTQSTRTQAVLTNPATLMGSPAYMSPEQFRSAVDVDQTTDIWSLGAILYELLAGRPPFEAAHLAALMECITQTSPPALSPLSRGAAPGLVEAVSRCLRKSRPERFQSVAELAQALAPFAPARSRQELDQISRNAGSRAAGAGTIIYTESAPSLSVPVEEDEEAPPTQTRLALPKDKSLTPKTWTGESAPQEERTELSARATSWLWLAAPGSVIVIVGLAWFIWRTPEHVRAASPQVGTSASAVRETPLPPSPPSPPLAVSAPVQSAVSVVLPVGQPPVQARPAATAADDEIVIDEPSPRQRRQRRKRPRVNASSDPTSGNPLNMDLK